MDTLEYYSAVLSSIDSLLVGIDCEGTVVFSNEAFAKNLGYEAEEILDKATPALWHSEEEVVRRASELSDELGQRIEPGFDVFTAKPKLGIPDARDWTFRRKDGSQFVGQLKVTRVTNNDNEIVGYFGVVDDLTELRRAQESERQAKAFVELIYKSIPDLAFVKDAEFRIVEANDAFLDLYPAEMRDKVIGYTTLEEYDQEEADAFLAKDREAFDTGESEAVEEITFPDGSRRLLETRKIRFEDKRGAAFILGIGRDVTNRVALVEKLRRTNDELQEFTYRISHDLRAPLVSSTRLIQLVRESIVENPQADEMLGLAEQSLTRLEKLAKEILVLARAGNEEEEPRVIDLPSTVDQALEKLSYLENYESLEIRRDYRVTGILCTKPGRLGMNVENMVSNAIKYHDSSEASPTITIRTAANKDEFVLQVDDNGLGIEVRHRKDLFRMFKRFHPKTSFGSGLGLYIMKKAAESLEGEVSFRPLENGSRFQLCIPFVANVERRSNGSQS